MPVLPKMGNSFSPENSRIWFSHHQILEVYFDQFEFLEWFSDKPTIFSTLEGKKMVMHFPWHLPQHFEYLFHFPSFF
jgi:hypothetical protein